jgi:hypothetical protein
LVRSILYIIALYLFFSSADAGNISPEVYVGGIIKNYKLKYITFSYTKDYLYFQKKIIDVVQTDKEGKFDLSFKWSNPWPLQMTVDDKVITLFLSPGDSLWIEASFGNLERSVTYSKSAGTGHNALKNYQREFGKDNEEFRAKLTKYDSIEFLNLNDNYHQEQLAYIKKDTVHKLSRNFNEYLNALINYNYYNNIFTYCHANRHYFDSTYLINRIDKKHVNNEYAFSVLEYIVFVENYISWQSEIKKSRDISSKNFWNYRYTLCKKLLTGRIRDLILARTVKKSFVYANHITAMTLYNDYSSVCSNHDYIQQIKNNFIH